MQLSSIQLISYKTEQRNQLKIDASHIRKFILSSYRVNCNLISDVTSFYSETNQNDIYLTNSI